jgi:hypothetical protein
MASAALVDACAMVAAFNPGDQATGRYQALLHQASQEHWSLLTTWPCVVEASYLLSPPKNLAMLRWVAAGAVSVFPSSRDDLGNGGLDAPLHASATNRDGPGRRFAGLAGRVTG